MQTGSNIYQFNREDAARFADYVGHRAYPKGNELVFTKCPYCGTNTDKKNKFSISLTTGQFQCKRASCNAHGNMLTLARDFDFELSEDVDRYFNMRNFNGRFKSFANAHRITESKDAAVKYLQSRGISEEICRKYEITVSSENENILVFPFKNEDGELKFIKYRNINFQKGDKGGKEWCEKNCMPILFGMNHCEDFETLVITEGQMDSLAVAECGIKNAVSVPLGMNGFTWVPHCWDFLQKFKEIVVFGDCENGIITLADQIKARFPKNTRIVREIDYQGYKDANDILQKCGKAAVINAIQNAEFSTSSRIKNMAQVQKRDIENVETIKSNMPTLDKILTGGFKVGSVVLISGKRGNGKSTFASELGVEALGQGYNVFMYSGELPDFFVRNWIDRQVYGKNPLTNAEIDKCGEWYNERLFIFDNNMVEEEQKMDSLIESMEEAIIRKGCKLLILDNLMTALEECNTNEQLFRAQSHFVGKLAKMAKKFEVIIFLVAHPRKSLNAEFTNDDVSGSSDITNKVDLVISYDRDEDKKSEDYNRPDVRLLHITKNRLTGRLGTVKLYFSEDSKRISDKPNNFAKEYFNRFEEIDSESEVPW